MFSKADAQPRTAESKAAAATHRGAVDLKHFCALTPAGFRLLSFVAVSLCFSLRYACAQSMPHQRPAPSVEGPSHTYLSASPSPDAVSPSSLAGQYAFGSWDALRSELFARHLHDRLDGADVRFHISAAGHGSLRHESEGD